MNNNNNNINFEKLDFVISNFCFWILKNLNFELCKKIWNNDNFIYNDYTTKKQTHHMWSKYLSNKNIIDYFWRSLDNSNRKILFYYFCKNNHNNVIDIDFEDIDFVFTDFCTWKIWFFNEYICEKIWYNNNKNIEIWNNYIKKCNFNIYNFWNYLELNDKKKLYNYYIENINN